MSIFEKILAAAPRPQFTLTRGRDLQIAPSRRCWAEWNLLGRASEKFGPPTRPFPSSSSSGPGFLFVSLHEHPERRPSFSKNRHSTTYTNNKTILADYMYGIWIIRRNSFCCGFSGKNFPLPELCLCWFQEIEPQQDSWLACWGQRGREEEEEVVERDLHLLHLGHGCGCLYEW